MNSVTVQNRALPVVNDAYSGHIGTFTRFLEDNALAVTDDAVEAFYQFLADSDYAANTVLLKRGAVKSRVRQMLESESLEIQAQLDRLFKRLDKSAPKPSRTIETEKVLSENEIRRLVRETGSRRTALVMLFLYKTGVRVSEAVGIKHSDCTRSGDMVLIRILGKGRKERIVKITAVDYDMITAEFGILRSSTRATSLFSSREGKPLAREYVTREVAKAGARILRRKISCHTFRHSFITHAIKRHPEAIEAISRYVGHASVATTLAMYSHVTLDDSDLLFDGLGLTELLRKK